MQAVGSKVTKALQVGSYVETCDNSGAKLLKIVAVIGAKTRKGRIPRAGVGDLIMASVKKGNLEMRKKVVYAVIVRQKKEYRRPDGTRIKFEDNAAVVVRDTSGMPKGSMIKGPIAREVAVRWSPIAKIASIIV